MGVQHPRQADRFSELIEVADAAVATSGDYVRFLDLERRYHHTIVPASGRSPQGLASVSVRAPTAMAADALATAVFVLGADAGVALIDAVPAAECLLLRPDGSRTASAGW